MTDRPRHLRGLAVLVAAVLVAGCGSPPSPAPSSTVAASAGASPATPSVSSPSASPSSTPAPSASSAANACDGTATASASPAADAPDPNAALYTKIEGQVEQLRGLTATTPVKRSVLDTAGLCAYLRRSFAEDNPADLVAATERLDKILLLLPRGTSLETEYLDLLTSQVAGLYDDKTKQMYVVSSTGAIGPLEQITYAHEFTHALQDQAFGLRSLVGDAKDQSDRSLARSALVEGDATLLMSLWAQQNLTPAELAQVASSADPAATAALDAAPAILREPLMFPYTSGLGLTLGAFQSGGGFAGVDALFKAPPDSTEQVVHPEKLAAREAPVRVTFPSDLAARLGTGWAVSLQDTVGELQLGILVRTGDPAAGTDPAAGWGGDRVALLEGPGGASAVVLDTRWDTTKAAGSFQAALDPLLAKLKAAGSHAAVLVPAPNRVVLLVCDSDATLSLVAGVLGLAG